MLSAKVEHFQAHLASYALEEGLQRISVVKIVRMCCDKIRRQFPGSQTLRFNKYYCYRLVKEFRLLLILQQICCMGYQFREEADEKVGRGLS